MRNKFIIRALVLVLAIMLSLTACSRGTDNPPNQDETENPVDIGSEKGNEQEDPIDEEDLNKDDEITEDEQEDPLEDDIDNEDDNLHDLDLEEDIFNPASLTVLANKEYSLGSDYTPEDLVTVQVPTVLENPEVKQLRKVAADALKEMFEAAKEEGIILHARSGYRSYRTQEQLFKNNVAKHGEEAANKFSARAGQSEHQTGLAMDITSKSVNLKLTESFEDTKEGKWAAENAHRFGFILRYPKDKTHITGYIYEPWHFRYVGVEHATKIYELGLTLEEYLLGDVYAGY